MRSRYVLPRNTSRLLPVFVLTQFLVGGTIGVSPALALHPVHHTIHSDDCCGLEPLPPDGPGGVASVPGVALSDRQTSSGETSSLSVRDGIVHWSIARANQIAYRRYVPGSGWQGEVIVATGGRYHSTTVVALSGDSAWVAWIEIDANSQSDVFTRKYVNGLASGSVINVSATTGPDRQLVAASDGSSTWFAWVTDGAQADVLLRKLDAAGALAASINVSETAANDWYPDISLGTDGVVHVVWDSYLADNYDVFYRSYSPVTGLGSMKAIATGAAFQAHASIAVDELNRVWVAWEEAQANWGLGDRGQNKADWDSALSTLNVLHANRTIKLARFDPLANTLATPTTTLESRISAFMTTNHGQDYPLRDAPTLLRHEGRTWLVFRYAPFNTTSVRWETYAIAVDDVRWYSIQKIADSGGYLYQQTSIGDDSNNIWLAGGLVGTSTGGTCFAGRWPETQLASSVTTSWSTTSAPTIPATFVRSHAMHTVAIDGQSYTTTWGDVHRHTELSNDSRWGADGTSEELYRYAKDAAKLQFVAQTDHDNSYMSRHYPRMQNDSDVQIADSFVPLYAYEFTATASGGVSHHNVISWQYHAYPGGFQSSIAEITGLATLWSNLLPGRSLAIPHTTAKPDQVGSTTSDLNDWTALKLAGLIHPSFHRVVEIYQAARTAYEDVNAPAPFGSETSGHLVPGTIRTMLEQDARLGFIASSDHRSTFYSFAVVYAADTTRQAVFEGLQARRCYASSSRDIKLELWVNDRFMGEEITTSNPSAAIRTFVSAPSNISTVTIMRDGVVWQTATVNALQHSGLWTDTNACGHAYYARVSLVDGNMAWSSPVWVDCVACTTNTDCNDNLFCNGVELCSEGSCVSGSAPCAGQSCDETTNTCVGCLTSADCNDGLFCNGSESCVANNCMSGTPPNCLDGIACTIDSCNESSDSCLHTTNHAACSDELFCNGTEVCSIITGCVPGTPPCDVSQCDEVNDSCASSILYCFAFDRATTVPSLGTVQNEDIVQYDPTGVTWSLLFDGSDVGLGSFAIDGLAILSTGDLLLSFTASSTIAGMTGGPSGSTTLDDSDIVRFIPTSLGDATSGSFVFYFDGSDLGFDTDTEDVDAIAVAPDGRLILSTTGSATLTGLSVVDEDLIAFSSTSLGATTTGTLTLYFDGSDVGLSTTSSEDVDGAAFDANNSLLLSTVGAFSVIGAVGTGADVLLFTPTQLGSTTSGTFLNQLDLSTLGISDPATVSAIEIVDSD